MKTDRLFTIQWKKKRGRTKFEHPIYAKSKKQAEKIFYEWIRNNYPESPAQILFIKDENSEQLSLI